MNSRYAESLNWLARAKKIIPSAAQTYSKSYRYYCEGEAPAFIERGKGSHVWDVDGNEYIDYVMALGPITLGYNNAAVNEAIIEQLCKGIIFSQPATLEVELAEKLVKIIPCAEMVRFVKNGSDATAVAVRLARAVTGKELVLACGYHGMKDWYIGSTENNHGVPLSVRELIKTFPYNDLDTLEQLIIANDGKIAAIIMEPVRVEPPAQGYLEGVRKLADRYGIVLVFDEVVTGFRIGLSGAQGYYGVAPDVAALGKGMANGMPISAVVGRADIMQLIDQGVFVSLTFGGEALSLAASLATIQEMEKRDVFKHTWKLGEKLSDGIGNLIAENGLEDFAHIDGLNVMPGLFFKEQDWITSNDLMALFQQEVLLRGILYLGVHYFCEDHSDQDIEKTLDAYASGFKTIKRIKSGIPLKKLLKGGGFRPIFARNKH
jgi:glutamate-1-semialdehyde 2,1-aminomutase